MRTRAVERASRRALLALLAIVLLVGIVACSKSPEGKEGSPKESDGVETEWTGDVSKLYPSSLDMSVSAAKTASQKLHLRIQEEEAGFMERTLTVGSEEMSAVIEIQEVTKDSTRVSVKVGWVGDADASRRIHSEIEAEITALKKQRKFPLGFSGAPPTAAPQ